MGPLYFFAVHGFVASGLKFLQSADAVYSAFSRAEPEANAEPAFANATARQA